MVSDAEEFSFALPDGTPILIRPIRPLDKELLRTGFQELSPESRYRRFFSQVDHLSDSQLRYLTEVDGHDHVAYIAVLAEHPFRGIGVARWVRLADEPDVAEGAVTVVDRYQGMGVGKTMLYVLAREGITRGVRSFRAWVIGENFPMLHVLQELGAKPGRWEHGLMELTLPLPATIDELDATTAPLLLKAVAVGDLEGTAKPERPHATMLEWARGLRRVRK